MYLSTLFSDVPFDLLIFIFLHNFFFFLNTSVFIETLFLAFAFVIVRKKGLVLLLCILSCLVWIWTLPDM